MGLVKKYRNGDKTEKPINKIVYENVGEYNAEDVAATFTEGLESYADSIGLSGAAKQEFMNKGSAMASAIKAGNVTKKANGDFSIKQGYNLNNVQTDKEIQKMKAKGDVGWGAKPYEGTYQRSHGAFTTLGTENLRESNHILGLVGRYLNSVLKATPKIGEETTTSKNTTNTGFTFDNVFARKYTNGNRQLLGTWLENEDELSERLSAIQTVLDGLTDEDYESLAETLGDGVTVDQAKERVSPLKDAIVTALGDPSDTNVKKVYQSALGLGFSNFNKYLYRTKPKEGELQKPNLVEQIRQDIILKNKDQHLTTEVIEKLVQAELKKYENNNVKALNNLWEEERKAAWEDNVKNYKYDNDPDLDFTGIILSLASGYDASKYNIEQTDLIETDYNKLIDYINSGSNKNDNKYKNVIQYLIYPKIRQIDDIYKNLPNANLTEQSTLMSSLYGYAGILAHNYPFISTLLDNAKLNPFKETLSSSTLYEKINDGPYKDWILIIPTMDPNYGKVGIFDPSKPNYKVKFVPRNMVLRQFYDILYEREHPKPLYTFDTLKVATLKLGGHILYAAPGAVIDNEDNLKLQELQLFNRYSMPDTLIEDSKLGNMTLSNAVNTENDPLQKDFSTVNISQINPVLMKDWELLPDEYKLTDADWARLIGYMGDAIGLFGKIGYKVGIPVSVGANGYANYNDWRNERMSGSQALMNFASNVGFNIMGALSNRKRARDIRGTNKLSNFSEIMNKVLIGMAFSGIITRPGDYLKAWKNFFNGNLSTTDIGYMIDTVNALFLAGGRGLHLANDKYDAITPKQGVQNWVRKLWHGNNDFGMKGDVTLNTASGNEVTISHELFRQLVRTPKEERNKVFLKFQEDNRNKMREDAKDVGIAQNDNPSETKQTIESLPEEYYDYTVKNAWPSKKEPFITTKPSKIDILKDTRKLTPITYTTSNGFVHEIRPDWYLDWDLRGNDSKPMDLGRAMNWVRNRFGNFGSKITGLPKGYETVTSHGEDYYRVNGAYYLKKGKKDNVYYELVPKKYWGYLEADYNYYKAHPELQPTLSPEASAPQETSASSPSGSVIIGSPEPGTVAPGGAEPGPVKIESPEVTLPPPAETTPVPQQPVVAPIETAPAVTITPYYNTRLYELQTQLTTGRYDDTGKELTAVLQEIHKSGTSIPDEHKKWLHEYYNSVNTSKKKKNKSKLSNETLTLLKTLGIFKQGGPLDFARIALYQVGGPAQLQNLKRGVETNFTTWYDNTKEKQDKSIGYLTMERVLQMLTPGTDFYVGDENVPKFVEWLNNMQSTHLTLHNQWIGSSENKEGLYIENPAIGKYQLQYAGLEDGFNNVDWNNIAMWRGFDTNFKRDHASDATNPDQVPTQGKPYKPDNRFSGITDNRFLLGREGSFSDEAAAKLKAAFEKLGLTWALDNNDKTKYYKLSFIQKGEDKGQKPEGDPTKKSAELLGGNLTWDAVRPGSKPNPLLLKNPNFDLANPLTDNGNLTTRFISTRTLATKAEKPEDIIRGASDMPEVDDQLGIHWGNFSEAARVLFLNKLNASATKKAMDWRVALRSLLHRNKLLEDDYYTKQWAEDQAARLNQQYDIPLTSDAALNLGMDALNTDRGNLMQLQAAKGSSDRYFTTRNAIQQLNNEDLAYNLNVFDSNNAALADKERTDAQLKASNILENANNTSNLWANYNQQLFENLARRQQLYNTYVRSRFANKRAAAAQAYTSAVKAANGDPKKIQTALTEYLRESNLMYDEEYNRTLDLLPLGWAWYRIPKKATSAKKGSRLTADLLYILESNKDFNKAMRENRREFHKNIRANNKNRRRKVE